MNKYVRTDSCNGCFDNRFQFLNINLFLLTALPLHDPGQCFAGC